MQVYAEVKVHMLAFRDGDIRTVTIPSAPDRSADDTDGISAMLDAVFKYGQNEFQPLPMPSVSVGDVIELPGGFWVVAPIGFRPLAPDALAAYRAIPRRDRAWSEFVRPDSALD